MSLPALTPSDAMALTMVGLFGFSLGIILTILWSMSRNAGRRPDPAEDLLEDDEDEPPAYSKPGSGGPPPGEPWERDADWWKPRD